MATSFKQVKNNAKTTTVVDALNNTTSPLTFSVASGTGSRFPSPGNGFWVTAWNKSAYPDPGNDPNLRIGLVTARTDDSFTVTWGQLGTSITAVQGAINLELLVVDQHLIDLYTAVNALENNAQRSYAKVVANSGGDYTVDSSTDISSTVTTAIASLSSGRTSVESILLRGNFTVNAHIVVPSYTRIVLDGTITTSTLRPSGSTNWSNNMGVFELGDRTTKPTTTEAWVVFTPGSKIIGDYFNTNASSYPQEKVNSAAAGFTDATLLNQKDVCAVHSYCTLINSGAVDVFAENMHGVIRYETLGRTNGTQSRNVWATGRGRYTVVGIETYVNGYQSNTLRIPYYHGENSVDDMVAIVGSDGGTVGASGTQENVTIGMITGQKNGLRGSALKIDGGSMTSGLGQVRNITVGHINVSTAVTSMSGVTQNEVIFYPILMGSTSSRNIRINSIIGTGWWRFGWRADMSGVDYHVGYFYAEALYGFALKSPIAPNDLQNIKVMDAALKQRNGSTGEAGSIGISIMGGSGAQGFKNIFIRGSAQYFDTVLAERGIAGVGFDGTITNVEYDIDVMDKTTSNLDFTSTNRRLTIRKLGQVLSANDGYTLKASCNTSTPGDAQTLYFGDVPVLAMQTSADTQRVYFPRAGTVKAVQVTFHQTAGSNETSTVSFRLNNTTDTTISSSVVNDAANNNFVASSLSIAVTTSDYFEIKWVTPTWATNPTNVRATAYVYVE